MTSLPLATVVEPRKVLVAARVSEPEPALVRPPALAPAAPPIELAKVRSFAPTSKVPPAESRVTLRVETSSAKPGPSSSVPPARVRLPVEPPMLASEEMLSVPSLIVVPQ